MRRARSLADFVAAARRAFAFALLAALAACSTLEGAQHPSPTARPTAAAPDAERAPDSAAAAPEPPPEPTPQPAPPIGAVPQAPSATAGATQALLAQSRAARAAGSYTQASATIERALRIAPSDARLWVELGEIELASGDAAQAATLARKALTLAADDSGVVADAQKLLRAAGGR
jgi:tetratricopeptide (TPR) repeat protein